MHLDGPAKQEERLLLEVRTPVRRFLRRIVQDPALAEDVESETMLTLIERLRAGLEIRRPISFALQVAWSKTVEIQRRAARNQRPGPGSSVPPQNPARLAELRDWLEAGFGAWKDRTDIGDSVEWQRRERAAWTRPWDDDYEEVKAESPDLFDAEDDRQRQIYLDMQKGIYPPVRKPDSQ